jgi:hypothetical protein
VTVDDALTDANAADDSLGSDFVVDPAKSCVTLLSYYLGHTVLSLDASKDSAPVDGVTGLAPASLLGGPLAALATGVGVVLMLLAGGPTYTTPNPCPVDPLELPVP